MGLYTYQALRSNGEKVTGQLQAQSRTEAYRKLDQQNLQPVSMVAGEEGAASNVDKPPRRLAARPHPSLSRQRRSSRSPRN